VGVPPPSQWVFTMMCMNNPEKCRTLPKIWNVLAGAPNPVSSASMPVTGTR